MDSKEIRERLIHYRAINEQSGVEKASRLAIGDMAVEIAAQLADAQVSLRDKFAIAALQGDWAAQDYGDSDLRIDDFHKASVRYYAMADAMLKAREVKS